MSNGAQPPDQPPDYAALAKQAGATNSTPPPPPTGTPGQAPIDYGALAKQAGAIDSTAPPAPATPQFIPGTNVPSDYLTKAENLIGGFTTGATQNIPFVGKYLKPTPQAQATVTNPEYAKTGETAGRMYEQALEQAAMGGRLRALGEGAVRYLPWLGKFGPALARIVAEGTTGATSAALHGQPVGTSAAIGAGGAAAGETLPLAAPLLKRLAVGQYSRALAPTTRETKTIVQDIAPEMMNRGLKGTLGGIETRAGKEAAALNPQLDQAYADLTAQTAKLQGSGQQILRDLENAKAKYMPEGLSANPIAVNAISGVQGIVRQYGNDISPNSLRQLKQIFDDPVAKAGGYAGKDLATAYTLKAQEAAANSIRDILGQASPDIGALNKEMNFWLNVQRVTSESGLRHTGQEGGLFKTLVPFGTTTLGTLVGRPLGGHATLEGAASGALLGMLGVAVRTPLWRTTTAVFKNQLADALASGRVGEATTLLARLGVAMQTPSPQESHPGAAGQLTQSMQAPTPVSSGGIMSKAAQFGKPLLIKLLSGE